MEQKWQKGFCNTFLVKLDPFDSHFIFQELWLTFLVKLNVTGFGKFFTKFRISWAYSSIEVHL